MANEVRIDVKANTSQAQSAIASLNKSWVGINSALEVGRKAAQTLGEAYNFLVGDTQRYNQSVLQMMRITGQNAETTSRMIQLTDDFGVSQEALTMAMRGAATKGIAFTTENLAKLSDEYLKLAPGVERTTFLVDQFGTRGAEMAKVLDKGSKAIREQSAAINANMLATDESIQASEDLRIAQDNLNDSLQGVKYTIGNAVIPVLVEAAGAFDLLLNSAQKVQLFLDQHNKDVAETAMSYDDYVKEMERANGEARRAIGFFQALGVMFSLTEDQAAKFYSTTRILTEAEYSGAAAAASDAGAHNALNSSLQGLASTAPNAAGAVEGLNAKMDTLRTLSGGIASAYNDMNTAQANLEAATKSFGEQVGGDLQSALEGAGVKGDRLHEALVIIDDVMGTSLDPAQKLEDITSQLASEYATGKITADEFRQKLVEQKAAMEALYQPIVTARVALQDMRAELELLTSKVWRIAIEMGAPIPIPNPGGGGGGGGTITDPYKGGGSGTPDVSGGPLANPFIDDLSGLGNRGGTTTGTQTAGGTMASVVINNLILPNVTNASQFVAELGRMTANARNSGRGTQGA